MDLMSLLTEATGIEKRYLSQPLSQTTDASASISVRMSWASKRRTTRAEDMAYCLLGIFGVNMSLLYGEGGPRAFARLQEEIMKQSTDHTIFAWGYGIDLDDGKPLENCTSIPPRFDSVLAPSPAYFIHGHRLRHVEGKGEDPPFQMTNKGLQIRLRLNPYATHGTYVALLNCRPVQEKYFSRIGIHLDLAHEMKYLPGRGIKEGDTLCKTRTGYPISINSVDCGNSSEKTVFVERDSGYASTKWLPDFTLQIASTTEPVMAWRLHNVSPRLNEQCVLSEQPLRLWFRLNADDLQHNHYTTTIRLTCSFGGPKKFSVRITARWMSQHKYGNTFSQQLSDWSVSCKDLDRGPDQDKWVEMPVIEAVAAADGQPLISKQASRETSEECAALLERLKALPYRVTLDSRRHLPRPVLSITVNTRR